MKIKNTKGFTLVELVVTMAITSTIILVIGSVFMYTYKDFISTRNTREMRMIADGIKYKVIDTLTYADTATISDEEQIGAKAFYFKDGRLYDKNDALVFPEDFYLSNKVDGKFSTTTSYVITLNLTISNSKGKSISVETSIKALNLSLNMLPVTHITGASGTRINYT